MQNGEKKKAPPAPIIVWPAANVQTGLRIVAVGASYTLERQQGSDAMGVLQWKAVALPAVDALVRPDPQSARDGLAYVAQVRELEAAGEAVATLVATVADLAGQVNLEAELDRNVPPALLAAEREMHALRRAHTMAEIQSLEWDQLEPLRRARDAAERAYERLVNDLRTAYLREHGYERLTDADAGKLAAAEQARAGARFGARLALLGPEPEPPASSPSRAPVSERHDDDHPTHEGDAAEAEGGLVPIPPPASRPPLPPGVVPVGAGAAAPEF